MVKGSVEWGEKTNIKPTQEVASQYGWQITNVDQLNKRITTLNKLSKKIHEKLEGKTPEVRLWQLIDKIQEVDKLVRQVSMIWISADKEKSQSKRNKVKRAIKGYENQLSKSINDTKLIIYGMESLTDVEKLSRERARERWVTNTYFQASRFLVSISFNPDAVLPTLKGTYVFPPANNPHTSYPPTSFNQPKDMDQETKTQNWGNEKYTTE